MRLVLQLITLLPIASCAQQTDMNDSHVSAVSTVGVSATSSLGCAGQKYFLKVYNLINPTSKARLLASECEFDQLYGQGFRPIAPASKQPAANLDLAQAKKQAIGCLSTKPLEGIDWQQGIHRLKNKQTGIDNWSYGARIQELVERRDYLSKAYDYPSKQLIGYTMPEAAGMLTLGRAFDAVGLSHVFYAKERDEALYPSGAFGFHRDIGKMLAVNPGTGECGPLPYGPKGVASPWQHSAIAKDKLEFDWFYDWQASYRPEYDRDPRYARMVWCRGESFKSITGQFQLITDIARRDYGAGVRGRAWLVLNEPDEETQCGATWMNKPEEAAKYYVRIYDLIKQGDPSAKIYVGGLVWLNTDFTRRWWGRFIGQIKALGGLQKIDGTHFHLYPYISTARTHPVDGGGRWGGDCSSKTCMDVLQQVWNRWHNDMLTAHGLGHKPVWITETGYLACNEEASQSFVVENMMRKLTDFLRTAGARSTINHTAWFAGASSEGNYQCTVLMDSNAAPTQLGNFWNRVPLR